MKKNDDGDTRLNDQHTSTIPVQENEAVLVEAIEEEDARIVNNHNSTIQNNTTTDKMDISTSASSATFAWTPITILYSVFLFGLAGVAEIVGGWMIWRVLRGHRDVETGLVVKKTKGYLILGSLLLIAYGVIPCLQPLDSFGRIYAAYGGFFIVLSFLLGWVLDGDKPDVGDVVGGAIALIGVCVILFWPRASS